jgi:uncharacterized protein (DUF1800 family)
MPLPPLEVIVLTRLTFGARPEDFAAFRALGKTPKEQLKVWLERQLEPSKIIDEACDKRLEEFKTLKKPLGKLWAEHLRDVPDNDPNRYEIAVTPTMETRLATMARGVWSKRQLLEVLSDFWHNHFNIDPDRQEQIAALFADFDKSVIRIHAFGNFRVLLEAVCKHPCMLYYLDNASSQRAGPNENFARELFELHTLGAENYLGVKRQQDIAGFAKGTPVGYVDDDVYEATRCFTGWRVMDDKDSLGDTGEFAFYPAWHDRFQKTVLGKFLPPDQGQKDGADVLDALAFHPGTARFISRKLCRRLVTDTPSENLVNRIAKVFIEHQKSPDQMKHVLRAIVYSDDFAKTWGEKVKRPLERYFSAVRALETEFKLESDRQWSLEWLGQMPFHHPMPDGYADTKEHWLSSTSLLRFWSSVNGLAHNWDESYRSPIMERTANLKTPKEITAFWLNRILAREPSPALKQTILDKLRENNSENEPITDPEALKWRVTEAVGLILMSPEFLER